MPMGAGIDPDAIKQFLQHQPIGRMGRFGPREGTC